MQELRRREPGWHWVANRIKTCRYRSPTVASDWSFKIDGLTGTCRSIPTAPSSSETSPSFRIALALPAKNLRDPFARLFMNPAPPIGAATGRNVRLADPQPIHQRRVGPCGMVMFESLHDVDPGIGRQVPPGEFAIRAVVPKTCSEK
jgi:hypothetical protein